MARHSSKASKRQKAMMPAAPLIQLPAPAPQVRSLPNRAESRNAVKEKNWKWVSKERIDPSTGDIKKVKVKSIRVAKKRKVQPKLDARSKRVKNLNLPEAKVNRKIKRKVKRRTQPLEEFRQ